MDAVARPSAKVPSGVLFDPQKRAHSPELRDAVLRLAAELEASEMSLGSRKRSRKPADREKFRLAVEAIVCNFLVLRLIATDRPLAVPKSSGVMWSNDRYASPVYGQHFLAALAAMSRPEVGWIEAVATGYRFSSGSAQRSTVRATPQLFSSLGLTACRWCDLRQEAPRETLILKAAKVKGDSSAPTVDYKETARTKALRNRITRLNARLQTAPIIIADNVSHLGTDDAGQPIDPTKRSVRRIFNNGKWTEGGRLFDGFWETMPREARFRLLRIGTEQCPDGEEVANVDYGQLFPRLAYMFDQIAAPDTDLYDAFGDGSCRDGFKRLFNALLFHTGTLSRWPQGTRPLFPESVRLQDAIAAIAEKHAPIAHHFGTGIGFRMMYAESVILLDVMDDLAKRGVTALPLHDAVLVARSAAEEAKGVLESALQEHLHQPVRAMVSIDLGIDFS